MSEEVVDGTRSDDQVSGESSSQESSNRSSRRQHSKRRVVLEWVAIIVAALLVSLVMRVYVVQTYKIPSGSMEPTLNIGDRIIVSKISLDFGSIHRGDILVFTPPVDACGLRQSARVRETSHRASG